MNGSMKQEVALGQKANSPLLEITSNSIVDDFFISSFLGPYVVCRLWFQKFRESEATSHSFLMSKEIRILPEFFAPSD